MRLHEPDCNVIREYPLFLHKKAVSENVIDGRAKLAALINWKQNNFLC